MAWIWKDLKDHHVPLLCHVQGHLPLDQVLQSHIQPGLEQFKGWGSHNFSGEPVSVPYLTVKEIILKANLNLSSFSVKLFPLVSSQHALTQSPSPDFLWASSGSGRCCKVFLEPSLLHEEITPDLPACIHRRGAPALWASSFPTLDQSVSDLAVLPRCNSTAAAILQAGCSCLEVPGRLKVSELHLHSSQGVPRAVAVLWSTGKGFQLVMLQQEHGNSHLCFRRLGGIRLA